MRRMGGEPERICNLERVHKWRGDYVSCSAAKCNLDTMPFAKTKKSLKDGSGPSIGSEVFEIRTTFVTLSKKAV